MALSELFFGCDEDGAACSCVWSGGASGRVFWDSCSAAGRASGPLDGRASRLGPLGKIFPIRRNLSAQIW